MESAEVAFRGADGTLLAGTLDRSGASTQVVVLVHGGMAHGSAFYHKHLSAAIVAQLGLACFRYDRNNNGSSEGKATTHSLEAGLDRDMMEEHACCFFQLSMFLLADLSDCLLAVDS
jgi:alpha-beta hydrolase superfamily lysophospholipase